MYLSIPIVPVSGFLILRAVLAINVIVIAIDIVIGSGLGVFSVRFLGNRYVRQRIGSSLSDPSVLEAFYWLAWSLYGHSIS